MIERERKYRITDEDAARLRSVLAAQAELVASEIQVNTIFRDRATRLRKGTYVRVRSIGSRRELTFKGKKTLRGLDKCRLELTVAVGDGPLVELLATIGLEPYLTYQKETEIWSVAGAHVSLDRVDGLGRFCEVEAHDDDADLQAVADMLELGRDRFEPRGYPTLAAELVVARNGSRNEALPRAPVAVTAEVAKITESPKSVARRRAR